MILLSNRPGGSQLEILLSSPSSCVAAQNKNSPSAGNRTIFNLVMQRLSRIDSVNALNISVIFSSGDMYVAEQASLPNRCPRKWINSIECQPPIIEFALKKLQQSLSGGYFLHFPKALSICGFSSAMQNHQQQLSVIADDYCKSERNNI